MVTPAGFASRCTSLDPCSFAFPLALFLVCTIVMPHSTFRSLFACLVCVHSNQTNACQGARRSSRGPSPQRDDGDPRSGWLRGAKRGDGSVGLGPWLRLGASSSTTCCSTVHEASARCHLPLARHAAGAKSKRLSSLASPGQRRWAQHPRPSMGCSPSSRRQGELCSRRHQKSPHLATKLLGSATQAPAAAQTPPCRRGGRMACWMR